MGPESFHYASCGILISNYYQQLTSLIIQNCNITNYRYGVHIKFSQVNIHINKTRFAKHSYGIHIYKSQGKVIIADSFIIEGTNNYYYSSYGVFASEFQGQITITATYIRKYQYGIHYKPEDHQNGVYYVPDVRRKVHDFNPQGQITVTTTWIKECQYGMYSMLTNVTITNTVLNGTYFGILLMSSNASIRDSYVTDSRVGITSFVSAVHIQNTSVTHNELGMLIATEDLKAPGKNISIANSITNCTFSSNNLVGLFLINYQENVQLQDSRFSRNYGSSIFAYQSRFKLLGETVFKENSAERGGGLALYNSTVTFGPGSNTQFINNTAHEFGGAIYIVSLPAAVLPDILINIESIPDKVVYQLQVNNILLRVWSMEVLSTLSHCQPFSLTS